MSVGVQREAELNHFIFSQASEPSDNYTVVSGKWLGGDDDLRRVYLATSDIGHPICLHIIVYEQELEGVYRLVLDGQLLCLAVDQRPNNYGMRGTLPVSSCHPVA